MYKNNLWRALLAVFSSESLVMILLNLDRLGNALAGGHYQATVSARVGYFAMTKANPYWLVLEKVINETFRPLDGPDHCWKAYQWEAGFKVRKYRRSSDIALTILSVFVLSGCLVLMPLVWLYVVIRNAY